MLVSYVRNKAIIVPVTKKAQALQYSAKRDKYISGRIKSRAIVGLLSQN